MAGTILAFDPGVTTGWAYYAPKFDTTYRCGELNDNLPNIYRFIGQVRPDVIVYENFLHRPNLMKAELYSLQVIGVIRLWAAQHFVPTVSYKPAETKAFWSKEKIQALGLWSRTYRNHGMDAMRALLTYRMKTSPQWLAEVTETLKDVAESRTQSSAPKRPR